MTNEFILLNCGQTDNSGLILAIILPCILAVWNFMLTRKIEQIKSDGQKQIHVHKTQFDKEFTIYENVWQKIIELREVVQLLRPQFDSHPREKTYEEVIKERVKNAVLLGNELIDLTEKNKPFYEKNVHDELTKINQLIKREIIEVQYGDKTQGQYWTEGKETLNKLITSSDSICETIRKRIRNINTESDGAI